MYRSLIFDFYFVFKLTNCYAASDHRGRVNDAKKCINNVTMKHKKTNYRGTERFLVSPELQSSVFELAKYAMTNENIASDEDSKYGAKLLEVVLQQCKGRIDHYIAPYLQITLQALQKAESPSYQDMLITVIANCLYYNAALTLSCLRDAGALGAVLQQWFRMIYELRGKPGRQTAAAGPKHFRRMHDKKVAVLGLTSILLLPDDQLPPEVAGGLPQLVAGIIRLLGERLADFYTFCFFSFPFFALKLEYFLQ